MIYLFDGVVDVLLSAIGARDYGSLRPVRNCALGRDDTVGVRARILCNIVPFSQKPDALSRPKEPMGAQT